MFPLLTAALWPHRMLESQHAEYTVQAVAHEQPCIAEAAGPQWVSPLTMRRNGDLASYANAIALTCSCSRSSCQRAHRYTLLRMVTLQEAVACSKVPDGCAAFRTAALKPANRRIVCQCAGGAYSVVPCCAMYVLCVRPAP